MTESPGILLVVDDDEAKRYLIAAWLRRAGHTVVEVATGREAIDQAPRAEAILLDVNLPDISGIDVCRQLKSDPQTQAIPVIQVSATAVEVADRAFGLTAGADAYLTEPTEPAELVATVTAALRYYRARRRAELTASRLAALTSVTLDINAAGTFDELARAAVAGATRIFGQPAFLVVTLPDGQVRRMLAATQDPAPAVSAVRPAAAAALAHHVLGAGEGSAATTIGQDDLLRLDPGSPLRTAVAVATAKTKPGRPPVTIAVAPDHPGDEEMQILRQLAQSTALAVEALRAYTEEHAVALTLQRSLLPQVLPEFPGLEIAVRYTPASDQAEVGGDFYEALQYGKRALVVIGDIQGHSLRAAAVMGELRHALRAFVSAGRTPLKTTGLVNQVLRQYHPDVLATLCLGALDPSSGDLRIVNCGHIPPLLVAGGTASYVGQGGLLLGMPTHRPHTERVHVPPGGTVLMITDGLIEDRRERFDKNMDRLQEAAAQAADAGLETFCDQLMSLFGPREDDVAMIAIRRRAQ